MFDIRRRTAAITLCILSVLITEPLLADQLPNAMADSSTQSSLLSKLNPMHATLIVQGGGFNATQGTTQNIGINGLIGDQFTVAQTHSRNFLLGLGYYINGQSTERIKMLYGLNAFYLAPTTIQGDVIQEQYFDNLSYHYSLTNYPIYLAAKALFTLNNIYNITFDLGIGPNIITTDDFNEYSRDAGITQPDTIFSGNTSLALSATAGIGIQFNNVAGHLPLEIGYRFFYLGQGHLNKINDQVIDNLKTGHNYANALVISVSF